MSSLKMKEGAAISAVLSDKRLNSTESTLLVSKLAEFFKSL